MCWFSFTFLFLFLCNILLWNSNINGGINAKLEGCYRNVARSSVLPAHFVLEFIHFTPDLLDFGVDMIPQHSDDVSQ